jgi:hypothetical protein
VRLPDEITVSVRLSRQVSNMILEILGCGAALQGATC